MQAGSLHNAVHELFGWMALAMLAVAVVCGLWLHWQDRRQRKHRNKALPSKRRKKR